MTPDHAHAGHEHAGHEHAGHEQGCGTGGHGGHGDHAAMFRRQFWLSLALTLPVVATSPMVMDWLGYSLGFPGVDLVGPVLGTVIVFWPGRVFLTEGIAEARARQPGMMLLIGM